MENLCAFLISLLASLIAIFVTLMIERYRLPKLIISVEEDDKLSPYSGVSWLFYKIKVTNESSFVPSLIKRQTAENCHANIEFYKNDNHFFTMRGRWSSTPQIPEMPQDMWKVISNFPQPVSIIAGMSENLDILAQCEFEKSAYGFNNTSYLHGWKNTEYELKEGCYIIKVNISTQNGIKCSTCLTLYVSDDIRKTALTLLK